MELLGQISWRVVVVKAKVAAVLVAKSTVKLEDVDVVAHNCALGFVRLFALNLEEVTVGCWRTHECDLQLTSTVVDSLLCQCTTSLFVVPATNLHGQSVRCSV